MRVHVYECSCIRECTCVCMCMCVHVYVRACMHIGMCVHVCACVYVCLCVVYVYICAYVVKKPCMYCFTINNINALRSGQAIIITILQHSHSGRLIN